MSKAAWPPGTGEMARRIRAFDWASTPLGPIAAWPQSLLTAVDVILGSPFASAVLWGPELIYIPNEAAAVQVLGTKFPGALGRPARQVMDDSWPVTGSIITNVLQTGETFNAPDVLVTLDRGGPPRQASFTMAFSVVHDEVGTSAGIMATGIETTETLRVQADLRASEERQAFLLRLTDALRPLADPVAIQVEATRVLARHLGASRAMYAEVEADDAHFVVHQDYTDGVPSLAGRHLLDAFGPAFVHDHRAGRTLMMTDAARDERVGETRLAAFAAARIGAFVGVPLVKGGRLAASLSVHFPVPHEWSPAEVALVEETAERTWSAVERTRAEEALRHSEAKYRALFESIAEGFCVMEALPGADGGIASLVFREVNNTFARQTGVVNPVGRTILELLPDFEDSWIKKFERVMRTGEAIHTEDYLRDVGRWYDVSFSRIGGAGSRLVSVVLTDVTTRKESELTLQASEASLQLRADEATVALRTLSRRLLAVQEEERRFLAQELHDEIGQMLTGLQLQLGKGDSLGGARLAAARETVAALTEQVRQLSMELRPAVLDQFGLLPALHWHIERYQRRTGVAVDLRQQGVDRRLPAPVEIASYRIVQEALTNVARHSGTNQAEVRLFADDAVLIILVRDSGCGFDAATTPESTGLGGMRERAELLGGDFTVDAAPGTGVAVSAELPLAASNSHQPDGGAGE